MKKEKTMRDINCKLLGFPQYNEKGEKDERYQLQSAQNYWDSHSTMKKMKKKKMRHISCNQMKSRIRFEALCIVPFQQYHMVVQSKACEKGGSAWQTEQNRTEQNPP